MSNPVGIRAIPLIFHNAHFNVLVFIIRPAKVQNNDYWKASVSRGVDVRILEVCRPVARFRRRVGV